MNIIQRNFFRLLRCGAFQTEETLEPMSVFKWNKLYRLAIMHNVQPYAYKGLVQCRNQFFLKLTDAQWIQWEKTIEQQEEQDNEELLRPDKLTNPMLNQQLQNILDDEKSDFNTRRLLIQIISIAKRILNEGLPLRLLIDLGLSLHEKGNQADYETLAIWLRKIHFQQMVQLEAALLIELFGFNKNDIPFAKDEVDYNTTLVAKELAEFSNIHQNFYFSQDSGNIFVHTSNSAAMFNHIKRSARYMKIIPSEAFTNFFASFAHSLTHIEE